MAVGIVLTAFLIWPVLFSGYCGVSHFSALAGYAITGCLFLWIGFFMDNGLIFALGTLTGGFLIFDSLKIFKDQSKFSLIEQAGDFIGNHWPVYAIVVSTLGFLAFVLYYRQVSSACFSNKLNIFRMKSDSGDYSDSLAARSAAKVITSFFENKSARRMSMLRCSRLFQFGLFSPIYPIFFNWTGAVIYFLIMTGMTALSFHVIAGDLNLLLNVMLPSTDYWITFTITMDFLSHRNRMPAIYLYAPVSSREIFIRTVFLSLLRVFGQIMLILTLMAVIVHAAFPWTSWTHFPQLCAMGIVFGFIQIAITLLASEKIQSPWVGAVWLLGNFLLSILLIPIAALFSHSWTLILACIPVDLILFRLALSHWKKIELEFA